MLMGVGTTFQYNLVGVGTTFKTSSSSFKINNPLIGVGTILKISFVRVGSTVNAHLLEVGTSHYPVFK